MKRQTILNAGKLAVTTVVFSMTAVAATYASADQTVLIGHAAPLTGGAAHLGKDNENGARLAVEEINAKGLTIDGQKITLQLDGQDDAGDPRQATQVAQKLVDDKVVGVLGHLNSGASIPASKIYSDAGIVQITTATSPKYTQQGFKTTYRSDVTDAQQGPALANYAAKNLHLKKIAVIDDATAYGQGLADEFTKTAEALGMTVVSRDATNDKVVDFRAILTKIKGENPDGIMFGGMDATLGPLAKQARQLGINAKIFAGDGSCSVRLPELAGDASANVVCSQAGAPIDKLPGGKEFEARYEKRFGEPVQVYAPFTYDGVYIIVDAMKRANSTDPAKILAMMPATDYHGLTGEITFDAHGELKHGMISLYDFEGGKKSLLDVVRM